MLISNQQSIQELNLWLLEDSAFIKKKSGDFTIFYKGNKYFEHILLSKDFKTQKELEGYLKYLDFGIIVLVFIDKTILINDLYGSFPIFYYCKEKQIYFSDNIMEFKNVMNLDRDIFTIADYFLFHHPINENTIYEKIKRLSGGSKIEISDGRIEIKESSRAVANGSLSHVSDDQYLFDYIEMGLSTNKIFLTLTGGFDSRLLLSLLLRGKYNFSSTTWGTKGNLQTIIAKQLSEKFAINHFEISLDEEFLEELPSLTGRVYSLTPDSPFILDMPQFIYYSDKIIEKVGYADIITGFMGSELMRGPSYSSEVLLTKFVAELYKIKSLNSLKDLIKFRLTESRFFSDEFINDNIDSFCKRYIGYSSVANNGYNNQAVIDYLLFEKYGKMYSQIIRLHNPRINLINPYLAYDFVSSQINRKLSNINLFSETLFSNYHSYKYYAKLISLIYPELLNTSVDKGGYMIRDLISSLGMANLLLNKYIKNKRRKTLNKYNPVLDYKVWYKQSILDSFKGNCFNKIEDVFDDKKIKEFYIDNYDNLLPIQRNSLIVMTGLRNNFQNL